MKLSLLVLACAGPCCPAPTLGHGECLQGTAASAFFPLAYESSLGVSAPTIACPSATLFSFVFRNPSALSSNSSHGFCCLFLDRDRDPPALPPSAEIKVCPTTRRRWLRILCGPGSRLHPSGTGVSGVHHCPQYLFRCLFVLGLVTVFRPKDIWGLP